MKPWTNPLCQVDCYICGKPGWNMNAMDAWHGVGFYCRDGCDPEDVRSYQLRKAYVVQGLQPPEPEYQI